MTTINLKAVNVCIWGEASQTKELLPGAEGPVPFEEAMHFLKAGAATRVAGGAAEAPAEPVILSEGNDERDVAVARRAGLLERCAEAGIDTLGNESPEQLQALLDAKAAEGAADSEAVLNMSIDSLDLPGLPGAAARSLKAAAIETVRDLVENTRAEVDAIKGLGNATMDALDAILEDAGLAWKA